MILVVLDELVEHWTLLDDEQELIAGKRGPTRLGFALLLKFYTRAGRFPRGRGELPDEAVRFVARQVGVDATDLGFYEWSGSTIAYHRRADPGASRLPGMLSGRRGQADRRFQHGHPDRADRHRGGRRRLGRAGIPAYAASSRCNPERDARFRRAAIQPGYRRGVNVGALSGVVTYDR